MPAGWSRLLHGIAWLATAVAVVELCGREVARRSLVHDLTGYAPGVVAFGLAIAVVVLALIRPGGASTPARTERAPGTPAPTPDRDVVKPRRRGPLLFGLLFAIGLAFQLQLGARLQSDGFYYFSYLRSLAFDGDLDFTNDYLLLGLGDKPHLFRPTPTGYAQTAASIGPAILWTPFFAGAHVVAAWLGATNPDIDVNGISFPYRQAVSVAGLFYGLIGCWLCFRLTARFYEARLAAVATTLAVTGSFMLWYLVKEPSVTHAPSMAAVAGFVWAWIATREGRTTRQWAWLGAIAGFMTLIRWQNALFALLPACDAIAALVTAARASDRPRAMRVLTGGALFTLSATLAFVPQMIAWHAIYGSWLAVSPLGPQLRWTDPQLADILWSSRNGLLSFSPILYFGAIGLVMFAAAVPAVGLPALLTVALMTYFNASIQDWWGSDGFGGRRFDGTIPLFCLGIAAFGHYAVALTLRHPLRVVAAAGAVLVVWNLTLMSAAESGLFRIGGPVSFGDTASAQARAFHRWFGNPFTYPASLVFALRNGLAPGQYDLLSVNRFLSDPLRPYGRVDIGGADGWLLDGGWHAAEKEGAITFRWAVSSATVFIPLDHAAPLTVQIRLWAFDYPGSTPQTLALTVNGRTFGPVPVPGRWETLEFATDSDAWRSGVNRLRLNFARARAPAEVGVSGDTRPLAAAVDYIHVQKQ